MAKILHVGKYYSPEAGGIESVTETLARGAAAKGHTVEVICFGRDKGKKVESIDGVKVMRAKVLVTIFSQPISFRYLFYCWQAARTADVIHWHAPNMFACVLIPLIKKSCCLVVHWHSDVVDKGFFGSLFRPIERMLILRANRVITTSSVYAKASSSLSGFHEKMLAIPIGIPDPRDQEMGHESLLSFSSKIENKRIILSVGRLVSYKGFDVLIDATSALPDDVVTVIVGEGPLREQLQSRVRFQGLCQRVLLVGRLDDNALAWLYRNAAIFALPSVSRAEAFGVVLLEAMAFGLPVIASDISGSGVPWVNKNGVSGFNVPVGNSIQLAGAINKVLNSLRLQTKLSQGARQRYLSKFTECRSIQKVMACYDEMLAKNEY